MSQAAELGLDEDDEALILDAIDKWVKTLIRDDLFADSYAYRKRMDVVDRHF